MTVAELIEELKKMPDGMRVFTWDDEYGYTEVERVGITDSKNYPEGFVRIN